MKKIVFLLAVICCLHLSEGMTQVNSTVLHFKGNDYLFIPTDTSIEPENLTIEGWFKFDNLSGVQLLIDKHLGSGSLDSYEMWYQNGRVYGAISDNAGFGPFISYNFSPQINIWYHLAYTFDDQLNVQRLFVNGALVQSNSVNKSISYDNEPLLLGASNDNLTPQYFFKGKMDEVRIWNYARSEDDIQSNMCNSLVGDEFGLVGYWKINEGTGQMTNDASIFSNHAMLGSTINIDNNDPEWLSIPIIDSILINKNCEIFSIQLVVIGGEGLIEYSIDGINFQTSNLFSDLNNTQYTLYVRDGNGCITSKNIEVEIPNALQITNVISQEPTCGQYNGVISILTIGGSGLIDYSINGVDFQSSSLFENLHPNDYHIIVVDEYNCSDTANLTLEMADFPQDLIIQVTDASCGNPTGSLSIFSNGGTGLLEYSIDGANFQTSSIFNNLFAGTYTVWVQDENNCVAMENAMIEVFGAPEIDTIATTPSSCGADDGSISINAGGGTGQLEYSIDGLNFQTTPNFNNLSGGTYTVIVQDEFDCVVSQMVIVMQTNAPTVNVLQTSPVTCDANNGTIVVGGEGGLPPYNYSIDGSNFQAIGFFENLSEGVYSVIVQDSEGCTDVVQIEIGLEESISIADIEITPTSCGGNNGALIISVSGGVGAEYSIDGLNFQSSNSFENLAPGNYTLFVLDNNNCQKTQMVFIEPSEMPEVSSIEVFSTSCGASDGSIVIDAIGGDLVFSINGSDYQQEGVFMNLASGDYTLFIKDENDCISRSNIQIAGSSGLSVLDIEVTPAVCGEQNGVLFLNIEGGTGDIKVALNGSGFQSNDFFNNLPPGDYHIEVIDEADCGLDTTVFINQVKCPVYLPNAFSPNHDGINDYFGVFAKPQTVHKIRSFSIFNRWGGLVFRQMDLDIDAEGARWYGKNSFGEVEPGVFAYHIIIEFNNGEITEYKGDVTVVK